MKTRDLIIIALLILLAWLNRGRIAGLLVDLAAGAPAAANQLQQPAPIILNLVQPTAVGQQELQQPVVVDPAAVPLDSVFVDLVTPAPTPVPAATSRAPHGARGGRGVGAAASDSWPTATPAGVGR